MLVNARDSEKRAWIDKGRVGAFPIRENRKIAVNSAYSALLLVADLIFHVAGDGVNSPESDRAVPSKAVCSHIPPTSQRESDRRCAPTGGIFTGFPRRDEAVSAGIDPEAPRSDSFFALGEQVEHVAELAVEVFADESKIIIVR